MMAWEFFVYAGAGTGTVYIGVPLEGVVESTTLDGVMTTETLVGSFYVPGSFEDL